MAPDSSSHRRIPFEWPLLLLAAGCGPPPTALEAPPAQLQLDPYFAKYSDADGIAVVASAWVADEAILEARRVILESLGNAGPYREFLVQGGGWVTLFPESDGLGALPNHAGDPPDLCGMSVPGERHHLAVNAENVVCRSRACGVGSVLLHELGHAIMDVPDAAGLRDDIARAYASAMARGLWGRSYGRRSESEYWAEAVAIYFDAKPAELGDGIATREQLKAYDPTIAELVERVFWHQPWRYQCPSRP